MKEKYEQMTIDTRDELEKAVDALTLEAILTAKTLTVRCHEAPPPVRNRHEAYGHAAEQMRRILSAVKSVKKDTDELLRTLSDPNLPALDATSSICNSAHKAAKVLLAAAAEMDRIRDDLYASETTKKSAPTPMDEWIAEKEYEEAPEDPDAAEEDPDLDEVAERLINGDFEDIPDEIREAAEETTADDGEEETED